MHLCSSPCLKAAERWLKMIEAREIMTTHVISNRRESRSYQAGRGRRASGTTLVEVIYAAVVISISVLGASGYRYHSALNARWANQRITASRVGQLFCGSWAGAGGDEAFDPMAQMGSELTMEALGPPKSLPPGFTLLGRYRATIEGVDYSSVLAWNDFSPELRTLRIKVTWDQREEDPLNSLKKSLTIITYVPK
jgi:hypothetical protein